MLRTSSRESDRALQFWPGHEAAIRLVLDLWRCDSATMPNLRALADINDRTVASCVGQAIVLETWGGSRRPIWSLQTIASRGDDIHLTIEQYRVYAPPDRAEPLATEWLHRQIEAAHLLGVTRLTRDPADRSPFALPDFWSQLGFQTNDRSGMAFPLC